MLYLEQPRMNVINQMAKRAQTMGGLWHRLHHPQWITLEDNRLKTQLKAWFLIKGHSIDENYKKFEWLIQFGENNNFLDDNKFVIILLGKKKKKYCSLYFNTRASYTWETFNPEMKKKKNL
jgi:hypothetical protein